jgi:branched-chain amino acid aminotransferase
MFVFLNGKFVPAEHAAVSIFDRGFLLGDGLFETVRVANGKPFRLAQHLERMSRGAEFLKIKLPFAPEEIQSFAAELVEKNNLSEGVLRLTLTRGAGGRGYSIKGANQPTFAMTLQPLLPQNSGDSARWSLVTSSFRIPAGDTLANFKTSSKILNVLARAEAEEQGADEALLLNTKGEVAETAGGNIFWVESGKICTVPIACSALPGITRAVILEICRSLGLTVEERVIKPEQLRAAEGIFVTQSVSGVISVAAFDGQPVALSPLLKQIAAAYAEIFRR